MGQNFFSVLPLVIGISGLSAIGLAIYWLFRKEAKKRHLEELRQIYADMSPTDPQYSTARTMFIAAAISDVANNHYSGSDEGATGDGGGIGKSDE